MDKKLFGELVESMKQMNEIVQGKRAPSRRFVVNAASVKKLRSKLGLSQPKFAALLHVDVGTLRNWEHGRREPTGPAVLRRQVIEEFGIVSIGQRRQLGDHGAAGPGEGERLRPPVLRIDINWYGGIDACTRQNVMRHIVAVVEQL